MTRPGNDTVGRPGQKPGLSASEAIPARKKAQGIDITKLTAPLKAFPDDTAHGGTPGHYAIAPADETGEVDIRSLEEWAMSRGSGQVHGLTQILLDAVVEPNAMGSAG